MAEALQRPGQQVSLPEQVTPSLLGRQTSVLVKCGLCLHPLLCRDRGADGRAGESSQSDPRNYSFRFNVQIQRDPELLSHGLTLTSQSPILVQDITSGETKTM